MRNSVFESLLGLVVIVAAGLFLAFALSSGTKSVGGGVYELSAKFDAVTGIERGTDVRMSGVKVGSVTDIAYNPDINKAVVNLTVRDDIELRDDASASIQMDGLLGGAFVTLRPGGGFDTLATDGTGEIYITSGSVDLLTLLQGFASMSQTSTQGGEGE